MEELLVGRSRLSGEGLLVIVIVRRSVVNFSILEWWRVGVVFIFKIAIQKKIPDMIPFVYRIGYPSLIENCTVVSDHLIYRRVVNREMDQGT